MFDRLMKRCGTRASGEQTLLAGVCVLAGLVTALATATLPAGSCVKLELDRCAGIAWRIDVAAPLHVLVGTPLSTNG